MIVYLLFPKLYDLYCHRLNEKIATTCNDFLAMLLTQFGDNSLELVFGVNTSHLLNDLTVFLEQKGRNGHNAEFTGNILILIHIYFKDFQFIFTNFLCQLLQDRRLHTAWTTPCCPKINQNQSVFCLFSKCCICNCCYFKLRLNVNLLPKPY